LLEETELALADGLSGIAVLPGSYLPRDHEEAASVVAAIIGLIGRHEKTGRYRIALRLCSRASLVARRAGLPRHAIGYWIEFRLAQLLQACGKHEEALAEIEALIELQSGDLGHDDPETLTTRYLQAQVLLALGRPEEARAVLAAVARARSSALGDDHPALLSATYLDAQILSEQGEHEAAYRLLHSRLPEYVAKFGARHEATLAARYLYAQLLARLGESDQALHEVTDLLAVESETLDQGHSHVTAAKHLQASLLFDQKRYAEALAVLRPMLLEAAVNRGGTHPEIAKARRLESRICLMLGRYDEALTILEELISALLRPSARGAGTIDPNHARTFEAGRPDCAALLDNLIQTLSTARGPTDPALLRARALRSRLGGSPKPAVDQRCPTGT
jgi:tetratricopeptide (TPR) repeat protein